MQVDDGDLFVGQGDPVTAGVGYVGPHQAADVANRTLEAANKSVDGADAYRRPRPPVPVVIRLDSFGDQIGELSEGSRLDPVDDNGAGLGRLRAPELGHHVVDHHHV